MDTPSEPESEEPSSSRTRTGLRKQGKAHYFPGVPDQDWNDWRWQFRNRVTTLEELARFLPIPAEEWDLRSAILRDFRMGITPYYLSLIDADDRDDPILRQVVPIREEYTYRAIGARPGTSLSSSSTVVIRLRNCQRQSFHCASVASGKKR